MKIDIITLSCATNYGAVLQTYALTDFLIEKGYEVKVIDYITERYNFDDENYVKKYINETKIWRLNPVLGKIWEKYYFPKMKKNRSVFLKFLHDNVPLTHSYYSNDELKQDKPIADIYITGSDQVWNSDFVWKNQLDYPYYFGFLDKKDKRISYASSFGKEKLDDNEKIKVKKLLKQYTNISVREQSAADILSDMNIKSTVVADPTILCNYSSYEKLILKNNNKWSKKNYILLFMINFDKKLYKMAKKISNANNKKLILLIPSCLDNGNYKDETITLPLVEDWLMYFKNADYIITNSFHGSVFSILFNVNFTSFMKIGHSGRISHLLNRVSLNDRRCELYDINIIQKQYNKKINYNEVNSKVEKWRKESQEWLLNQLKKKR